MAKCTFCGNPITPGTGLMFVYAMGKVAHFCSRKCEKNLLYLNRKPMETAWTQEFRKEHRKIKKEK